MFTRTQLDAAKALLSVTEGLSGFSASQHATDDDGRQLLELLAHRSLMNFNTLVHLSVEQLEQLSDPDRICGESDEMISLHIDCAGLRGEEGPFVRVCSDSGDELYCEFKPKSVMWTDNSGKITTQEA